MGGDAAANPLRRKDFSNLAFEFRLEVEYEDVMPLIVGKVLIGAFVGVLIGMSGMGGGVALLPILIFGLGVPALTAVGSAAAFNAFTKVSASWIHWRNKTVNWSLVAALAAGSLPGTLLGALLLGHLRSVYGSEVNTILRTFIGVLLVCIPAFLLIQGRIEKFLAIKKRPANELYPAIVIIGLIAGFLVGVSSVGSGSVIMALLLTFVQSSPVVLVASDIAHAVALTGFASLLDWHLGMVDMSLVLPLLIGSIPGSFLGVKLSTVLPGQTLRFVLYLILMVCGARMLWA